MLLGNKADLESEREVSKEEGEKLAQLLDCKYYETSAKTGQNVNEALDEIAKITYLIWKKNNNNNRESIRLSSAQSVEKVSVVEKKKCCSS